MTGPVVPTFLYGTAWKEERTSALVTLALEAGFRGFDTANQRKHYHEAGVGEALRRAWADGVLRREDLFLQTKYTYRRGQDHRLPFDPNVAVGEQVQQSFASSLTHLGTDHLDAFLLHGPASGGGWTRPDREAWIAMESLVRDGKVSSIGVSNVDIAHLRVLCTEAVVPPSFVQNRCYAHSGWDRDVRVFCRARGIVYQGFSLLTANRAALAGDRFRDLVRRVGRTPAQVLFRAARQLGILPLTGTSDPNHMREDLGAFDFELAEQDVAMFERLGLPSS